MAVIPVGATLDHRDPIGECLVRLDSGKTKTGNSVDARGQTDGVPMNEGHLFQTIRHRQRCGFALAPSQCRSGHRAVDCCRYPTLSGKVHRQLIYGQVEVIPSERRRCLMRCFSEEGTCAPVESGDRSSGSEPLNEAAAGKGKAVCAFRSLFFVHNASLWRPCWDLMKFR
jgi:hypothetical protein